MLDCYRDPSVLQFVAISAWDAYTNLKRGKLMAAAKNIFDRRNFTSLKAVWDDRKWIGGVCGSAQPKQKTEPLRQYAQARGGK